MIGLERIRRALRLLRTEHERRRLRRTPSGALVHVGGFEIRTNDGPNLAVLVGDVLRREVYRFHATRPDPLVLDCGANIGLSVLYAKTLYPGARIHAFEPDPAVFLYLEENVARAGLDGVESHRVAVAGRRGTLAFWSDGKYSSTLADYHEGPPEPGWKRVEVEAVPLADYLVESVDFLKMNIEGAEWDALEAAADRLQLVSELVVEYHHLPGLPRTLHKILELLHDSGFEYVVSDFGLDSYPPRRPPIELAPDTRYYRHVYARRFR